MYVEYELAFYVSELSYQKELDLEHILPLNSFDFHLE